MNISVIGAGAFGTALAISLAAKGPVRLWARDAGQAREMQERRENARYLPGIAFPPGLEVGADFPQGSEHAIMLLAVPMQQLRGVLNERAEALDGAVLVACCKGIELGSGAGPLSVITDTLPGAPHALLTGPSFASDIARGLPTALTLAASDAAQGRRLQERLSTRNIRLYRTTDVIGAELGGALKNVVAIGCGAAIGAGLGASARAALMTRGYAEMQRMARAMGARTRTLAGLSGFGDLVLTCTSEQSRNYRLGLAIGGGREFDSGITVEGAATARAVAARAPDLGLDMPITDTVVALLDRRVTPADAMARLLARPLKEE
ncbi:NAD(P)H-dependent glycerol-3-phosphate dehydrogenase [Pontibaca methylaminivorans]|uniref:Glycerol-3-phosphate dehydrogenase [NAD(P)+] n=1 Tax=Pontibaca methylaminivorans TaxID=515897 RepID=A0A1R3WSR5_9RHOB|nr:NAD(P)H-dependent glycerol-3-phosphate dehydrogenase [Pontibaca methylaminivorans]SIT81062.1 glycerol-3-phosphate dehydrogenase (NAD(P)+) [Pontibaca methylaminivorans]